MAHVILDADVLTPGELSAAGYLEQNLPADWLVIVGRELVHPTGAVREVDFIVVGEHLVYAVEEKAWWGKLFGNDRAWVLSSGESRRSPLNQAGTVARPLAGLLRRGVPGVRKALGGAHFVYAAVLLSARNAELHVNDPRCDRHVWMLNGSEQRFAERDQEARRSRVSISRYRDAIMDYLTGLPQRPEVPARINAYSIEESLGATGPIRAYAARHEDGTRLTLKLLPRPGSLSGAVFEAEKRALLREYDTLRELRGLDIAPSCDPYFYWQDDAIFVVPIAALAGRTLRAHRTLSPPETERFVTLLSGAFESLAALHAANVIHRSLGPDRIWICDDGKIRFSDFVVSRLPDTQTIADMADYIDPPDPYRAPECRMNPGFAAAASDVYCLCAAFLYWLTGQEPDEYGKPPDWIGAAGEVFGRSGRKLVDVCARCLEEDERKRPTAEKVASLLSRLHP
ncbi:MAG: NERD domain-containing protein [Phycisphaerae bacterium]|nr:NERD domain-containing protein [Phycisphaerae bacterium]